MGPRALMDDELRSAGARSRRWRRGKSAPCRIRPHRRHRYFQCRRETAWAETGSAQTQNARDRDRPHRTAADCQLIYTDVTASSDSERMMSVEPGVAKRNAHVAHRR